MQKLFAIIGIATIIFGVLYFLVYFPLVTYQDLSHENHVLKSDLTDAQNEVERVYKRFDQALRAHLPDSQVNEIYSDTRFFQQVDTEISVTESEPSNYKQLDYYH